MIHVIYTVVTVSEVLRCLDSEADAEIWIGRRKRVGLKRGCAPLPNEGVRGLKSTMADMQFQHTFMPLLLMSM